MRSFARMALLAGISIVAGVASRVSAAPGPAARARAVALKANLDSFRLDLVYHGDADKPYYRLSLSVAPAVVDEFHPFARLAQVSRKEASGIVDHLSGDGFLEQAMEATGKKIPAPPMPCYTLTVSWGRGTRYRELYEVLGWGLPLLRRLDRFRGALSGDALREMDRLLGRLEGHRREWSRPGAVRSRSPAVSDPPDTP